MTKPLTLIITGSIFVVAALSAIIVLFFSYKPLDQNSQIILVKSECERISAMGFHPIPFNQDSCLLAPAAILHTGFSNHHVLHIKAANKAGQMMLLTISPHSLLTASEGMSNSLF